jgi:hypothetical protein
MSSANKDRFNTVRGFHLPRTKPEAARHDGVLDRRIHLATSGIFGVEVWHQ